MCQTEKQFKIRENSFSSVFELREDGVTKK